MKLDVQDRSKYLKGLLVLIGKDKKISENESNFILNVGKILGFDREFCEEAISTLLENEYITDDPPHFSNQTFAMSFIEDAISIAIRDNEFNGDEILYLSTIADENKIDKNWFDDLMKSAKRVSSRLNFSNPHLAVEKHL